MTRIIIWTLVGIVVCVALVTFGYSSVVEFIGSQNVLPPTDDIAVALPQDSKGDSSVEDRKETVALQTVPDREVVAENLTIPWDIVFLPGGDLLVAERDGMIVRLDSDRSVTTEISVEEVSHRGEGGLLGMTLHPQFSENGWLYLYMTTTHFEEDVTTNRVVRYRLAGSGLVDETLIIDNIPGALYHDGGRIAFGPDGFLYITTGDAGDGTRAQDTDSLAGKILRLEGDGSIPEDNPFGNAVYSYGHRNPQGLTWDRDGNLWSTEHGRTTATLTGMDELNIIVRGGNYGWPDSEGDAVLSGTIAPEIHSGPSVTWAPASVLYWDGSVFFGGLRGEALYEAALDETSVVGLKEHFKGEYGRIRTVVLGPDGAFYMTTSNRDGRGEVRTGDDKIIRLDPSMFRN